VTRDEQVMEVARCLKSPAYFVGTYGQIYDATAGIWLPFALWPAQVSTLDVIHRERFTVILKARQLGLSWLVLGYGLWLMIFRAAATILLFSKRDDEAVHLLSDQRLRGMYKRLPDFLKVGLAVLGDNDHEWGLSNGSVARAFPTSAGDSYTATLAIVDEADLVPDLGALMRAVKPTIDGGGRMILLSRADKSQPQSEFKRIYRGAKAGRSPWRSVFLPWQVRPSRDAAWYEEQRADVLSRSGSEDDLHEQYPATDTEALAPRTLDKRLPPDWLERCYVEAQAIAPVGAPSIPDLTIYKAPVRGRRYVAGADPAEGNPTSDDSAAIWVDAATGEEVAELVGKFQPDTFASYIDEVGRYYNHADVLVERNNHGHAVILALTNISRLGLILGRDERLGWQTSGASKADLYSEAASIFRDHAAANPAFALIYSFATFMQLASISGATLSAPVGEHDDRAVAYVLAQRARSLPRPKRLAGVLAGAALTGGAVRGWGA
jgi:hypothetical protein